MHISPGRLRIRSPRVRGDIALAERIIAELRCVTGVIDVKINITTGSIVVTHDSACVSSHGIVNLLISRQWVDNIIPFPARTRGKRIAAELPSVLSKAVSSQAVNKIAGHIFKRLFPLITERYFGKSAARIVAALL